ncbi:MAG: hypothetical protein JST90_07075 [Bacteroidetes bacterium]|nr:hypothetical protein [Bacteroidota bacterium]
MNSINNNLLTTIIEKVDREELLYQLRKSYDDITIGQNADTKKKNFPLGSELFSLYIEFKILSYLVYRNSLLSTINAQEIIDYWVNYISTFSNRISEISGLTIKNMQGPLMDQLTSFEEGIAGLPYADQVNAIFKEEFIVAPHRRIAFKKDYARIRNTVTTYGFRDVLSPIGNEEKNIRKKRK